MQYDKHVESLEYDKMQYDKLFSFFYHIDFENMIKKKTYGPRREPACIDGWMGDG